LFRIAKFCESAGYGFDRMLVWKKETQKEVLFETSIDKTKVTFMLKERTVNMSGDDDITQKHTENTQKTHRKHTENTQKMEHLILDLLRSNAKISRSQIATQLNLTEAQVIHYLKVLKKANLIRREGADKGGKWVIIE